MSQSATVYFKQLSDLLLGTKVTDSRGKLLPLDEGVNKAFTMLLKVKAKSGKVMLTGNGGSAAIASHMQNDLCNTAGVRAMVFTEGPMLTALANDYGYEHVFERPVALWADTDDLLIAISSSGQSENILQSVRAASARGCRIITLSGFSSNNPLRRLGDINFYVSSSDYGRVESAHAVITHFICDVVAGKCSGKENPHD